MNMKILAVVVLSVGLLVSACSPADQVLVDPSGPQANPVQLRQEANLSQGGSGKQGNGPTKNNQSADNALQSTGEISAAEMEGILFMLEEEKLARDVYLQMAESWNLNIFSNIARSEQMHMDAVLDLIDVIEFDLPIPDAGAGEFTNQELQSLYNELVEKGNLSLVNATLVGGAIEEIDILDLQAYLAETTDPAIIQVYQNLLKGSVNHLASFARTYQRQSGETYQPQFMSEEDYQDLISSSSSTANGSGGQGKNGSATGQGRSW